MDEQSVKCTEITPGYFQCDNYLRPVFTLTNVQLVNRTFAVMSLLLLGGCLILMLIGMECSRCFLKDEHAYRKVIIMKESGSIKILIKEPFWIG